MTSERRGDPRPKWILIGPFMLACFSHMQVLVIQFVAELHLKNQVQWQCCSIFFSYDSFLRQSRRPSDWCMVHSASAVKIASFLRSKCLWENPQVQLKCIVRILASKSNPVKPKPKWICVSSWFSFTLDNILGWILNPNTFLPPRARRPVFV